MFGYIFAICCMVGWYGVCRSSGPKCNKNFLTGMAILMTLFYGLRGADVGADTGNYLIMFVEDGSQPLSGLWKYMWEQKSPAYVLTEWLFYRILPFPQMWLIASSAFFFIVFSKFLEKNSMDPLFSYFIFFTIFGTFQMTGIRQSCAMAVLMLAFEEIKNKKLIKYCLLVWLAFLFHKSAIVFLPFYFIKNRRVTKLDMPIVVVLILAIYSNRVFLFDFLKSFTSYDHYEHLNHDEPVNFSIMIYAATFLAVLLCLLLTIQKERRLKEQYLREVSTQSSRQNGFVKTKLRGTIPRERLITEIRKDKELALYSQYANAMMLSSLFMPLVAINGAMRRIVMYFALFMVLMVPKAFREFIDAKSRGVIKFFFCAFLLYLCLSGIAGSKYEYYLYFQTGG